jgi:hypothetical protein
MGPDPAVALIMIGGTVWSYFIHATVGFRLGTLEWLIASPAFRHWHHTNDEHRDRNLASVYMDPTFFRVSAGGYPNFNFSAPHRKGPSPRPSKHQRVSRDFGR